MLLGKNIVEGWRSLVLHIFLALLLLTLLGRYYVLMIVQHETYAERATSNHIRAVPVAASRGVIFDRRGEILVDNIPSYTISVIPRELKHRPESLRRLAEIMGVSEEEIQRRIAKNRRGAFVPAKVFGRVPFSKISLLEEHRLELIGITYSIEPVRSYMTDLDLSHVLGYTREINRDDLKRLASTLDYQPGDQVGWKGIEKAYERYLHGTRGFRYLEVNALGQEMGEVLERPPIKPLPGKDLVLTIDPHMQASAEWALGDSSGSVLILNYRTGEILAYASKPGYDLELLSGKISESQWQSLISDPKKPLYDRSIQGLYPAGSTLKPIAGVYSLEHFEDARERSYVCNGSYRLGNRNFGCWKAGGHGKVDLHQALEQSCNVYFYNLIQDIGLDEWATLAADFGLGNSSLIDLPEEKYGLVPTTTYMNRKYGENKWTRGNLLNIVVGQGDILVTPLQLAQYAGILAQKGYLTQPHVVREIREKDGKVAEYTGTVPELEVEASDSTWQFIHDAMWAVINAPDGTAKSARQRDWELYGKTGTAQNPHGEDHAWFIGFSLDPARPWAWAVLVENGGGGGGIAAPILGRALRQIVRVNT